jgi:hypothetical protein
MIAVVEDGNFTTLQGVETAPALTDAARPVA